MLWGITQMIAARKQKSPIARASLRDRRERTAAIACLGGQGLTRRFHGCILELRETRMGIS